MRGRPALALVVTVVRALGMVPVGSARAAGEDIRTCEPACDAGAICLNGICVVPAPPATAVPDAVYPEQPDPYPPPAHGYPAAAHPPPLTTPRTPRSGGFQPVLYAGAHALNGEGMSASGPGLRLGAILGGRATEVVSANGEITVDVFNFDSRAGGDMSGSMFQMTFSPLFHAATARADIVIGPKLGAWALSSRASAGGASASVEEQGWTFGANAGVFFPVGQGSTALGMLFSAASLQVTRLCRSMTGSAEQCSGGDVDAGDFSIFSLTFAAML